MDGLQDENHFIDLEQPVVNCPSGKKHVTILESDPGKASTKIHLPTPSYSDDSEAHGGKLNFIATLDGRRVSVKQEHELSISGWKDHEVKYMVTDESGKTTMCYFYYRVLDKEPPVITGCPTNLTKTTDRDRIRVGWIEPTFTDNSGQDPHVSLNRHPYHQYYIGVHKVIYMSTDRSGNEAVCQFYIIVRQICKDTNFPMFSCDDVRAAANLTAKCNSPAAVGLPIPWKHFCRKTCNDCS
ncbi:Hypothetical predicted protein [Paramuricea clavata]|uniref:Uncharacterized protein n=1 Tax=Paramuricea clavata TaxID=317549 RepID=A0A6S7HAS6_PARCT|nr:Hypothetical predicted protein [Paramuricea clavata]